MLILIVNQVACRLILFDAFFKNSNVIFAYNLAFFFLISLVSKNH